MKMRGVDMHVHSDVFDGDLSPESIVKWAIKLGLDGIAFVEHDMLDSYYRALKVSNSDIMLPTGIEPAVKWNGAFVHMLGYFFNPFILSKSLGLDEPKQNRNREIIAYLEKQGYKFDGEDKEELISRQKGFRKGTANYLYDRGFGISEWDVGVRIVAPVYNRIDPLPVDKFISKVHSAGGVVVTPHPYLYDWLDNKFLIKDMKERGAIGVEVDTTAHHLYQIVEARGCAKEFGLIPTGGSDLHIPDKRPLGSHVTTLENFLALLEQSGTGKDVAWMRQCYN